MKSSLYVFTCKLIDNMCIPVDGIRRKVVHTLYLVIRWVFIWTFRNNCQYLEFIIVSPIQHCRYWHICSFISRFQTSEDWLQWHNCKFWASRQESFSPHPEMVQGLGAPQVTLLLWSVEMFTPASSPHLWPCYPGLPGNQLGVCYWVHQIVFDIVVCHCNLPSRADWNSWQCLFMITVNFVASEWIKDNSRVHSIEVPVLQLPCVMYKLSNVAAHVF